MTNIVNTYEKNNVFLNYSNKKRKLSLEMHKSYSNIYNEQ